MVFIFLFYEMTILDLNVLPNFYLNHNSQVEFKYLMDIIQFYKTTRIFHKK